MTRNRIVAFVLIGLLFIGLAAGALGGLTHTSPSAPVSTTR